MDTVYTMLTTNITSYAGPFLADLRNTEEDAGCLERGIKCAIAEVGYLILSVVSLIETIARTILSLPFIAITSIAGFDKCPKIVRDLALAPLINPAVTLTFMAWSITNIYKEELGSDDDSSAIDVFPCAKPYFQMFNS